MPEIINRLEKKFPNSEVLISAIEVYNDEFYSLKTKERLYPKEAWGSYEFQDYQPESIRKENTQNLLEIFINNRYQLDTKINRKSSRSHAIFKIQCEDITIGIADLAGSERLNKANTNIDETTSINKSLLSLGRCIQAFKEGSIIPFRESKLTKALMEYFGINFKVYMIAHLNRSITMFHENLKVLEYAALTKKIKPLNMNLNPSIVKSARKNYEMMSKSAVKFIEPYFEATDD